jgi:hypothetical protein
VLKIDLERRKQPNPCDPRAYSSSPECIVGNPYLIRSWKVVRDSGGTWKIGVPSVHLECSLSGIVKINVVKRGS